MDRLRLLAGVAVCLILAGPVSATFAQDNTLTDAEKKSGWKLLYDGKSTAGWRSYKQPKISDGWSGANGELARVKDGAGDIITEEQFDSFELSLEFKISKGGNSGIMFHVTETEDAPWKTGPEIQVQDNVDGHDPQKAGWLYQLYQPNPDPWTKKTADSTRPAGQWNHVQVRVTPVGSEINVNGYRYATFKKGSDDWNARVAKSKFAAFPNFGKPTKGHIALQDHGNPVAYKNIKVRILPENGVAPDPIDGTLPLKVEVAFPNLKWAGWEPVNEQGLTEAFRPIIVTNAADNSNRLFVADQRGKIYVFQNSQDVTESKVFLDIRDRVQYKDNENEEGFLGMAFHPMYKQNGEFFVYYTTNKEPHVSVVSRFRVSKDDPNLAIAASEEEILRIPQPFWNHNGGTLAFGKDNMLYIGMGDGGSANDPLGNGQKMDTLLGKILRINIDAKDPGLNYAIPKDNHFYNMPGARKEIYAVGFRNIWRMSFDRETGELYAADVGQNLWEEINIVVKGHNYGWGLREGRHSFGPYEAAPRTRLDDPIWEYDHQVGLSITGGLVYRGRNLPELYGKYLYADFVTGKLWALKYDPNKHTVLSNEAIPGQTLPVITFGDDEAGEVYFTIVTATGKGIYRFTRDAGAAK